MLAALQKGDLIVTSGGLHGRVEGTGDDGVVLKVSIADGVRVDILRSSITYTKKGGELIEG
jgi:preprotein translocase YajC subunit